MCGRVYIPGEWSEIKIQLKASDFGPAPNWEPSFNVAPTDMVPVSRFDRDAGRVIEKMRWGMIPWWAKELPKNPNINARSEGLAQTPAYRDAWKAGRRCIVSTGGFYEWKKLGGRKQPYAIARNNEPATYLGAIWDEWKSPAGERIRSASVITTDANELIEPLHNRMPVIIAEADLPKWLGEESATPEEIEAMLRPFPSDRMRLWPVSEAVNNVKNNRPDLLEPVQEEVDLFGS